MRIIRNDEPPATRGADRERDRDRDPEREPEEGGRAKSQFERYVLLWVREPMLWPVLIVILGHVVLLAAIVLLRAFGDGSLFGWAGLALLVWMCAGGVHAEWRQRGRLGVVSMLLLLTWVLAAVLAFVLAPYDVF